MTATDTPSALEASALQESAMLARRFVALAFCRADLLFELDSNQTIKFVAGATPPMFGKSTNEMVGQSFMDIIHDDDKKMVTNLLQGASDKGRFDDVSIRLKTLSSSANQSALAGYRVPDFENNFFLAVKVSPRRGAPPSQREMDRDIEARVLNKESFATVAAQRIKDVTQAGGEAKMTMVKIDNLERLKKDLSQQDQSKLMVTIGSILSSHSLGADTAGRIDDESFSFIHDQGTDTTQVGNKIEAAAKEIAPGGVNLNTKTSVVDTAPNDLSEEQMAKAISYTMKNFASGKKISNPANLSDIFETMMAETMKHVDFFKKVCSTRAFDLVYMPICELKTGAIHHFEALSRFRTGVESPYGLITLAEEIGIISEFDLAVAQKAVAVVNKQAATAGQKHAIAVNISGHSIQDKNYVSELHALLKAATNLSHMLMFEITESAEIKDLETVNSTIQEFRSKGFKFALDDFGAGAASFDYLNSFDIDTVKFDGPVVKRAYATDKGKAFLASMATLCRQTGVETIAEMVENKPLADFLLECGINLGQGWYFGKPDPDMNSFKAIRR